MQRMNWKYTPDADIVTFMTQNCTCGSASFNDGQKSVAVDESGS